MLSSALYPLVSLDEGMWMFPRRLACLCIRIPDVPGIHVGRLMVATYIFTSSIKHVVDVQMLTGMKQML